MARAQHAKSPSVADSDAHALTRVIRRIGAGRIDTAPVLTAVGGSICALVLLAWLERSVATGFRIYILVHALKTAWDTTIALGAATLAAAAVDLAARRPSTPAVRASSAAAAFITAIAALGAMLPDWSEFTCVIAAAIVVFWVAVVLIASRESTASSNE